MCIVDSSLFAEKEPDMLTPFTVLMPANIRFGRGQAQSAAPWLAQQGGPILLVHGASPQRAAFLRQQLEALDDEWHQQHNRFSEQQKCLFIPVEWLGRIEASLQDVGAQIKQAKQP